MQQELIFWSAAQLAAGIKARRVREADAALASGQVWGPLHGVPFALKDAHATAGMRTTTGFPPLDHVPHEESNRRRDRRIRAATGILSGWHRPA